MTNSEIEVNHPPSASAMEVDDSPSTQEVAGVPTSTSTEESANPPPRLMITKMVRYCKLEQRNKN
jgi:hypothetical protein